MAAVETGPTTATLPWEADGKKIWLISALPEPAEKKRLSSEEGKRQPSGPCEAWGIFIRRSGAEAGDAGSALVEMMFARLPGPEARCKSRDVVLL